MNINKRRLYRFAFFLTLSAIAWLSLLPNDTEAARHMPSLTPSAFEMHVLAYAVAVGLGFGGFGFNLPITFGVFLYGTFLEIAQHFIPTRSFNPFDALANAVGILLCTVLYGYFEKRGSAPDSA